MPDQLFKYLEPLGDIIYKQRELGEKSFLDRNRYLCILKDGV
jgi:hypothetical protein